MLEIKHNSMAVEDTVRITKAIGNKIYDCDGKEVGKVKEFSVDPKSMRIEGVWSSTCFTCADEYIGRGYIDKVTEEGVMLSINPLTELIGKHVLDSEGKEIGKVASLSREKKTNSILSILVNRGLGKEDDEFPIEKVKSIGEKVILSNKVE